LEVSKEEVGSPEKKEVLSCELSGFDVLKGDPFKIKTVGGIVRDQVTQMDTEKGLRIDIHRNRLITIQALNSARNLADQGYLDQARNVLNQAIEELTQSTSSRETLSVALLQDLRECLNDMESRTTYNQKGKMKMAMYEKSHTEERGCHSKGLYSNSKKMSEKKKYVENVKRKPLDQNQIDNAKQLPLAPTRAATQQQIRDFEVGNRYRKLEQSEFTSSTSSPTGFCEHEWTMYVQLPSSTTTTTTPTTGSSEKIEDLLEKVVFILHPTFDPNTFEVTSPSFELTKKGWGVFPVECILHFKAEHKREPFKLFHQLVFGQDNNTVTYHIPFGTPNLAK